MYIPNSFDQSFGTKFYGNNSFNNNSNSIEKQNNIYNERNPFTEKNKGNKKHFICKKCNTVPLIEFNYYNIVHYSCLCHEIKGQTIESIFNLNISDESKNDFNNNESNNIIIKKKDKKEVSNDVSKNIIDEEKKNKQPLSLKCLKHKKKFAYYCLECELNVCRKCISHSGEHKKHLLKIFDIHFNEINQILEDLKKYLEDKDDDTNEIKKFKELMNIIIEDYKNFPNYNHFFIIESCKKFIKNINDNNNKILSQSTKKEELLFIKNQRELEENFNNAQIIEKITINSSNSNIIQFMNILIIDLINLKELDLNSNNIKSIEPLANKKLNNLEYLNLAINEIDDSNIEYFFQLDFPKLNDLNLFQNKLTDPKIFKLKNDPNKLTNLKIFFIGNNRINFKKNNIIDNYNFSSLSEIGISKNCFDQESIINIQCFAFANLEKIYLNSNNLQKFDFLDNLVLPSIKEFWLNYNYLNEFYPLKKYKTLEIIEMSENYINDIENLEEFIKSFNCLKKLNLEKNNINYDLASYLSLEEFKRNNNNIEIIINFY